MLFTLSSCDLPIFNWFDTQKEKKLNYGEVGDQEIWLSTWKVSRCEYSGTTKKVEFLQNEGLITSVCCSHELFGNKCYSMHLFLKDEDDHYNFYASRNLNITPTRDRHILFVPYEVCNWIGEKTFSYKVEIRDFHGNLIQSSFLEYIAIGK